MLPSGWELDMNASRVVVVGAACAGLTAAESLRRSGWEGEIVLVGDEDGAPYDRPPLSKAFLMDPGATDVALRPSDAVDQLNLRHFSGISATRLNVDTRTIETTGGTFEADGVIVATGVRARKLSWLDGDRRVRYLRTKHDATLLSSDLAAGPGSLVVLGGGPLGLEAAVSAAALGWRVSLVEAGPQIMPTMLGSGLADRVVAHHRSRGVDVRTSAMAVGLDGSGLQLASGDLLPADLCLVAVGAVPNTEWLADTPGLRIEDGLVCDEFGEAAPLVYGAGDVARWLHPGYGRLVRLESRTNAVRQAMTGARNLFAAMLGEPEKRAHYAPEPFFWSDQGELRLKAYGDIGGSDRIDVDGGQEGAVTLFVDHEEALIGFAFLGVPMTIMGGLRQAIASRRSLDDVLAELSGFAVQPPTRTRRTAA